MGESRPLGAKPFWRSIVGMAGLDMSVSQGTQRHSRASSASKVNGECQKSLLVALGQAGYREDFFKYYQSVISSLEKVSRNSCPFGTCPKISISFSLPCDLCQHSASLLTTFSVSKFGSNLLSMGSWLTTAPSSLSDVALLVSIQDIMGAHLPHSDHQGSGAQHVLSGKISSW